jgi:1-acyl-sn-glycerol-3-phosphate acyltransferase
LILAWLRSVVHAVVFYGGSVPIVLFAMLCVPFGPRATIFGARRWGRWHHWCARWILGIHLRIEGELPQDGKLVIFKHESFFETAELLAVFDAPIAVMKQEALNIPVWGWCSRAHGSIGVDREAGASTMRRMIAAAKAARATGRPVILFPEGTRVAHGETPELRAGFAGMYKALGLPVVPVALDSGKLWPRHSFTKYPGIIRFVVGDVIPAGLPRDEAEARVHAAINALAKT